ncbi:MAG: hypothetical protein HC862_31555 [Scytonema sp. RU_4_4]|nr:hypothetical protein [Scytonema sp. RU_4_4]
MQSIMKCVGVAAQALGNIGDEAVVSHLVQALDMKILCGVYGGSGVRKNW